MKRWAVNWSEGMPLAPQHFQAADRYTARRLEEAEDWARPFGWGLRRLTLNVGRDEAVLMECEARFKDGSRVAVPEDYAAGELRVDLGEALRAPGTSATIFLALPADGPSRHEPTPCPFEDEAGGDPIDVELRRPKAELLVLTGDARPAGYQSLPLARIGRSARPGAEPEIIGAYVPPLLALDAWKPLAERIRELSSHLHARVRQLAGQLAHRRIDLDPKVPGDPIRILKLHAFNAADAHLRALAAMPRLAPWDVFLELCRTAGEVALFAPDRHVAKIPAYSHDDPGPGFAEVIRLIELALGEEEAPPFDVHPFKRRDGDRLVVDIESAWRRERRPVLLGVTTDLESAACEGLLRSLDISIASAREVDELNLRKIPGLEIRRPDDPPPGLPVGSGVAFFELADDDRFRRDIDVTRTMAIKVNPTLARFRDERHITAGLGGSDHELGFALYVFQPPR